MAVVPLFFLDNKAHCFIIAISNIDMCEYCSCYFYLKYFCYNNADF